jgi:hypothetical protein
MDNFPDPLVCEPKPIPRPSWEDWKLILKGAQLTSQVLSMPWLRPYIDHEVYGVWYWENLCMLIGSVTGGYLTFEDYRKIELGVMLHAVLKSHNVPRMLYKEHECCDTYDTDDICDICDTYRLNLLMQFGFELSKFLRYDGVDGSVFDDYGYTPNDDGYDADGYDADGYDANGYDAYGYDVDGYDAYGYHAHDADDGDYYTNGADDGADDGDDDGGNGGDFYNDGW